MRICHGKKAEWNGTGALRHKTPLSIGDGFSIRVPHFKTISGSRLKIPNLNKPRAALGIFLTGHSHGQGQAVPITTPFLSGAELSGKWFFPVHNTHGYGMFSRFGDEYGTQQT